MTTAHFAGLESATSLKACGWTPTVTTKGGTWNRASRAREDRGPLGKKVRWERQLRKPASAARAAA